MFVARNPRKTAEPMRESWSFGERNSLCRSRRRFSVMAAGLKMAWPPRFLLDGSEWNYECAEWIGTLLEFYKLPVKVQWEGSERHKSWQPYNRRDDFAADRLRSTGDSETIGGVFAGPVSKRHAAVERF